MCARAKVTKIALNLYFDAAVLVIASLGGAAKYWLCRHRTGAHRLRRCSKALAFRHRAAPASATKQSISLQAQGRNAPASAAQQSIGLQAQESASLGDAEPGG
ncbi:MAG: hypothetical protein UIJ87_08250 [Anaerovoracaceae bacterium]|nr:hypothetical protein [Anaerovoracaceae bacterium]